MSGTLPAEHPRPASHAHFDHSPPHLGILFVPADAITMSSGFVPGGTIDKPTERDDEWRAAQAEIEAKRLEKEDRDKQHDGKSLYEVLQANKGATYPFI